MVQAWLDKPNGFEERNNMWFRMAKKKLLGEYVYDMAIARHQSLSPTQWHVAYLISAGYTQPEMVELLKVGLRTIQYTVEDIKERIRQEYKYTIEDVNTVQMIRWFLGL